MNANLKCKRDEIIITNLKMQSRLEIGNVKTTYVPMCLQAATSLVSLLENNHNLTHCFIHREVRITLFASAQVYGASERQDVRVRTLRRPASDCRDARGRCGRRQRGAKQHDFSENIKVNLQLIFNTF